MFTKLNGLLFSIFAAVATILLLVPGTSVRASQLAYPPAVAPAYQWHTFLGSSNIDSGNNIVYDGNGNIYLVGQSLAGWSGPGAVAPRNGHSGGWDIVVVKLNGNGAYQWHTFLGSSNNDYGYSLAVDSNGEAYVTGESAATWNGPGTTPPRNNHSGNSDIVVVKLNSSGAYLWHTFMGSNWYDYGYGVTADGSGGIYIAGESSGNWSGPGPTAPKNGFTAGSDAVILKLNSSGDYQWHTFMGGNWSDTARSIAVDGSGGVYIAGDSNGGWNGQAPINSYTANYDVTVLKLNSSGAYQWHTFMGGSGEDKGRSLAVDNGGNVYVAGESNSGWNGLGGATPINGYTASYDIAVLKLNSNGVYQWHTFMGSWSSDYGRGLSIDGNGGHVYVAGYSGAGWNGPAGIAPIYSHAGASDITILNLDNSGAYQWHTFVGGSGNDSGYGVAAGDGVYVVGGSSNWNAPEGTAPLNTYAGSVDITVLKVSHTVYLPIILTNL